MSEGGTLSEQKQDRLTNVICIMLDSLRYDHLGCYSNDWIETPAIDRLAQESVVFENAYPEGLPTLPVRTELFTGQCTLHNRPWQPLAKEDVTAAQILSAHGYRTALIADTYHFFKPGMNYHKGFKSFQWIRGQEADAYKSGQSSRNVEDYSKPEMRKSPVYRMLEQYLTNTDWINKEEDYFTPRVMITTMEWLETNYNQGSFFLWIDNFDPH